MSSTLSLCFLDPPVQERLMSKWNLFQVVPKVLPAKRREQKLFRDSIFISTRVSFQVSCHCCGWLYSLLYVRLIDDDENRDRNCRRCFYVSLLLNGKVLFTILFAEPTINLELLLPHQLIRLNLASLPFNLVLISLNQTRIVWYEMSYVSRALRLANTSNKLL